ncbi:MAG: V-type ATP synthase subunit I [Clostridiales bacterium]|nr:V-type ATP synthase subunit I [Clostridiales bacterium]
MAVSKMKKLSLFALSEEADVLIHKLTWLSCIEFTKAEEGDEWFTAGEPSQLSLLKSRLAYITEALGVLKPYERVKKGLFSKRAIVHKSDFEEIDEALASAKIRAEKILDAKDQLLTAKAERNKAKARQAALIPYQGYDLPLGYTGTKEGRVLLGTLPISADLDEMKAAVLEQTDRVVFEKISADSTALYYAVICHAADVDGVARILGSHGFLRADFTGVAGTAYEAMQQTAQIVNETERMIQEAEKALSDLVEHQDELQRAADLLSVEITKAEAKEKLLYTKQTVCITGWVPEQAEEKVKRALDKHCCAYELTVPEPEDEPPVLLQNNKWAKPFTFIVNLYSLPKYGTFDPTFVMSLFYFLIFGMMLADVVYGLLLLAVGFVIYKCLDVGKGVKNLALVFAYCGLSCVLFGVLFGGYLGDLPVKVMQNMLGVNSVTNLAVLFDPATGNGPILFLGLSLGAGALHLAFGMGIQAWLYIKEGNVFAAVFDIGSWYVLFVGIGLLFVNPMVGGLVAGAGVLMLILTQGRDAKNPIMRLLKGIMSLYDIVNYVADLLSYSRIMALGLASAIIASVVNTLATLNGGSVIGWILMTVIVLFGHTVNLVINLLGTFVHTSRLQYIEFFGKFYVDGGREFKPAAPETTYTRIADADEPL